MANFCILRVKKLKNAGSLKGSLSHAYRTRETKNADPDKPPQCLFSKTEEQALAKFREQLKLLAKPPRSNSVHAIEYFVGLSPEAHSEKKLPNTVKYFNDALAYFQKLHGKNRIFSAVVHNDETTPHMTIYAVPVDEKKHLNARHFCGGRAVLGKRQTEFWEAAGKPNGLERGLKKSGLSHEDIKKWYTRVNEISKLIEPPKKNLEEKFEDYLERYKKQMAPVVGTAATALRLEARNRELEAAVKRIGGGMKANQKFMAGLTDGQKRQLKTTRGEFLKLNAEKRKKKTLEVIRSHTKSL
jgi:hypothetical protein